MATTEERNGSSARRDLVCLVFGAAAFAALCVAVELNERVMAWTRPHERYQLDELPGILLFIALGFAWYGWRRMHEVRLELARRRAIEARLEQALAANRALALAAVRSQEDERRSLARELHDELGQSLNAVKLDAVALRDWGATQFPEVKEGTAAIIATIDRVHGTVRDIVKKLRPSGLDELGLSAAIENCVEGWRRRLPGVDFRLDIDDGVDVLDEATRITLFRLVQEGLTNVAKHAGAGDVDIHMHRRDAGHDGASEVVLTMRDSGVGSAAPPARAGLGLVGMRERVELLAGRFELTPPHLPGFGFVARLPMPA